MRPNVEPPAPSVRAACSCSSPISRSVGTTSRATNGRETKIVARTIDGSAKRTWSPVRPEPVTEPTAAAVEQEQRQTDDHGRQRERQVDERVEQTLAGKSRRTMASAHTTPKTVFNGTAIAVMIRVSLKAWIVSACSSCPRTAKAVLERAPEDDRERAEQDRQDVADRDEAGS